MIYAACALSLVSKLVLQSVSVELIFFQGKGAFSKIERNLWGRGAYARKHGSSVDTLLTLMRSD